MMISAQRKEKQGDKTLIVITGPTASGKSALSIALAQRLRTQIISADSRQIYHGIPISTAMPSEEERRTIRHLLMDRLPLDAYYSASAFEQDALDCCRRIWRYSDTALLTGGSMMYVDAVCNGIDELPTVDPGLRASLAAMHEHKGDSWLLERLRKLDPEYCARVDRRNIKRVFHAVEISIQAGMPYSTLLIGERKRRDFRIFKFFLDMPRENLFSKINARVDTMMESGLLEEARNVYHLRHLNSLNTVGLKELFSHFDGKMTLTEAVERIKKNTRVYAKKQLTWFAKDKHIIRIDATQPDVIETILQHIGI